jgi:hypothetical protein
LSIRSAELDAGGISPGSSHRADSHAGRVQSSHLCLSSIFKPGQGTVFGKPRVHCAEHELRMGSSAARFLASLGFACLWAYSNSAGTPRLTAEDNHLTV